VLGVPRCRQQHCGLGTAADPETLVDLLKVLADGVGCDAEAIADFAVRPSACDVLENGVLTRCKTIHTQVGLAKKQDGEPVQFSSADCEPPVSAVERDRAGATESEGKPGRESALERAEVSARRRRDSADANSITPCPPESMTWCGSSPSIVASASAAAAAASARADLHSRCGCKRSSTSRSRRGQTSSVRPTWQQ
jgi:hypothetical protein